MNTIIVKDEIKTELAVTSDKAQYIYTLIKNSVDSETKVYIDFTGIKTLTTAFLNGALGKLYSVYEPKVLNDYVHIVSSSLTDVQKEKVRLVMQNAKSKVRLSRSQVDEELYNGEEENY